MRQAAISFIPRKDKNLSESSSFQPISLLNVDDKLEGKMLA